MTNNTDSSNAGSDKEKQPLQEKEGYVDVAHIDVQCHVMIKDKDTGKILVNKRG